MVVPVGMVWRGALPTIVMLAVGIVLAVGIGIAAVIGIAVGVVLAQEDIKQGERKQAGI